MFPLKAELLHRDTRDTFTVFSSVVQACGYNISSKDVLINVNGSSESESDYHHCFLNLRELLYISYAIQLHTQYVINEGSHSEQQEIFKLLDLFTLVKKGCKNATYTD